jgi:aspartate kinase
MENQFRIGLLRMERAIRERTASLEERLRAVAAERAFSASARAAVLGLGERLSVPIVAAALGSRGLDAHPVDAASLVRTDEAFAEATVDYLATRHLVQATIGALGLGALPVVTGFLGATLRGETTLLGRGGSDLTAAVLGWALDAERVEIWSDVDGLMTADRGSCPRRRRCPASPTPRPPPSRAGAKVLHPRTLEPSRRRDPGLRRQHAAPRRPGTWIGPAEPTMAEAEADGTAA